MAPPKVTGIALLAGLALAAAAACGGDGEAICTDESAELCDFASSVEAALAAGDVDFFVHSTQFEEVTCPIPAAQDYTEACGEDEPAGTVVGRVSQPQLTVIGGGAGGHGALVSPESYRNLLALLFDNVVADASDDVGSGAFGLYAISRRPGDAGSRRLLATGIVGYGSFGLCEATPCRLLLEFAAYPNDAGWAFRSMTTIGPAPDALSVWLARTDADSWLLWP